MKIIIAAVLFSGLLCASQSATVTSSCNINSQVGCYVVALPNSAPWNARGMVSNRWETRIHGMSSGPGPFVIGPIEVLVSGSNLIFTTYGLSPPAVDGVGGAVPAVVSWSGMTDVLIRLQRDQANQLYTLQACPTQGGNCSVATFTITTPTTNASWVGYDQILGSGYSIAWVRWFSTVVPVIQNIANSGSTGDIADWEFEGTAADSVSGLTFAPSGGGTISYSTTPVYNPSCNPGNQQTFPVGQIGYLDGSASYPLDGGTTLAYAWSYPGAGTDGVTQASLAFGAATAKTTLTGFTKGSVNVQLIVTDASSNSSTCTVHDGAVVVDADDKVITGLSTTADHILGKLVRYGSKRLRTPWYDSQVEKALLDVQGAALSTNFPVYWNAFESGTVAVSPTMTCGGSGSGQGLVGSGTSFNSYTAGDYLVIAWNGGANRTLAQINTIVNNNCVTLVYPYQNGTTETGLSFVHPAASSVLNWGYGNVGYSVGDYYDNKKAYRSFYERSGIDTYWGYYTYLADAFWAQPANDLGAAYGPIPNQSPYAFTERFQSAEGIILRATDSGKSGMWSGIRTLAQFDMARNVNYITQTWITTDTRESAYGLLTMAEVALLDPVQTGGSVAALARAQISSAIPGLFSPGQFADGSIPTLEVTGVDTTHAVAVTHNSTTATCAGCAWTSGFWSIGGIATTFATHLLATTPADNTGFSTAYYPTYVNSTTITLDRPYTETSSSGANTGYAYAFANGTVASPIGWGEQPFMAGIQLAALIEAYKALLSSDPTNAALALTLANNLGVWLTTKAYADPANGGLGGMYYYQGYKNCAFPVQTAFCTVGFNQSQSRSDAGEVIRGLLSLYLLSPTPTAKVFLEKLLDQMFCAPGFGNGSSCVSDTFYVTDLGPGGSFFSGAALNNKWVGFFDGWCALINALAAIMPPGGNAIVSGANH